MFSLVCAALFTGCGLEVGIEDLSTDFLKTTVISKTVGVADGITELIVTLELKNSNDKLVIGHTPKMKFVSGVNINFLGCSKSNENGHSVCRMRSVYDGTALIRFDEINIELETDVQFSPPDRNGTFLQVLSAAQHHETITDHKITSQAGAPVLGLYNQVGGHHFFTNTTSVATPIHETINN